MLARACVWVAVAARHSVQCGALLAQALLAGRRVSITMGTARCLSSSSIGAAMSGSAQGSNPPLTAKGSHQWG